MAEVIQFRHPDTAECLYRKHCEVKNRLWPIFLEGRDWDEPEFAGLREDFTRTMHAWLDAN